ncbi:flagellin [Brevibacillus laterosporus]|nr:flagellin [Brevibacillus laterosporus]TPH10042.1 flagellin [Brevibacillus laterosporus]
MDSHDSYLRVFYFLNHPFAQDYVVLHYSEIGSFQDASQPNLG